MSNFYYNFDMEKQKLNDCINFITVEIEKYEKTKAEAEKEYIEINKNKDSIFEHPDVVFDLPVTENLIRYSTEKLKNLYRAKSNPYFGKLIYKEKSQEKEIYIGKTGLFSPLEKSPPVIDWRAPLSSVYYDSKTGENTYNVKEKQNKINLLLKRIIKIYKGELKNYYDSDTVTSDEMLIDCLSKSGSGALNEIIATIQKEQNEFIRKPLAVNLIVQGEAGSGKTTVAVHRISYLIYKYKDKLKENNILFLEKDNLLLKYISAMLPDLDVEDINQYTVLDIITEKYADIVGDKNKITEKNETYINFNLNDVLIEYNKINNQIFDGCDLIINGFTVLSGHRVASVGKRNISMYEKAEILDKEIEENHIDYRQKNTDLLEDELHPFIYHFKKKVLSFNFNEIINKYKNASDDVVKNTAAILTIHLLMYGRKTDMKIKHIVIDEAQDIDPVIYFCLKRIYPSATFTITGDLNQKICTNGIMNWNEVEDIFGERTERLYLNKTYRNTIEITSFARNVMNGMFNRNLSDNTLERHGKRVSILKNANEIKKYLSQDGFSTAVICKDKSNATKLLNEINDDRITELTCENIASKVKTFITTAADSKGLEFDRVFIPDFDSYGNGDTDGNLLYVVMTRALHELYVVSENPVFENKTPCDNI
ncbi:MAG: AAA family ATPase [Eubacteriales bacterium]|nr:AAA family ATPase [Eubacteriales bacterium]